jgi:DNA-binding NarL/FixJ family response regulator
MTQSDPIRLIIVDDHPLLREGVANRLSAELDIQVAAQGATADEAIRLAAQLVPDMVLLDMGMPGGGISAITAIVKNCPSAHVVMFTANNNEDEMLEAFKAGACGYVLKDVSGRELVGIVRRIHAGERYVPPTLAADVLMKLFSGAAPRRAANLLDELTKREQQILTLLATGASNKEIGQQLQLTEKTVKYYTSSIFQKLNVRNRVEAAMFAVGNSEPGSA